METITTSASPANCSEYSRSRAEIVTVVDCPAANDCAQHRQQRHAVDVNAMVGRIVGHVMSKLPQGPSIDVQLVLAAGRRVIEGDPVALSFALSGILTATLASTEEGEVSVTTAADTDGVRITIASDGVPPLGLVRAIAGDASMGDPTLVHCRRLIEAQGGSIRLVEDSGRIALQVAFPSVCPSNLVPLPRPAAVKPAMRSPSQTSVNVSD